MKLAHKREELEALSMERTVVQARWRGGKVQGTGCKGAHCMSLQDRPFGKLRTSEKSETGDT
jgi:hypothetical protein